MTSGLKDLEVGQKAVVAGYDGSDEQYRAKLLAMGLTKGSVLTVVKVAPLGDPVEIKVRGYHLSLRKDEAAALLVEVTE